MKLFGLTILTKSEKEENDYKYYLHGMEAATYFFETDLVDELERLKQDHWDKDAFDRLINQIKR